MKNLLFLSLMLMAGTLCFGQGKDYVTWEESGCDTEKYIITNFESNQERYIGQKLSKLLDDIEPPMKWAAKMRFKITRDSSHFIGLDFFIYEPTYEELKALYRQGKIDKYPIGTY